MILRAKRKRVLRGRNHVEGYPGGLIETMNDSAGTDSLRCFQILI
jgi:hypothetical protein